jgi:hypothetical protein
MNKVILIVVLSGPNVAVLAHSQDNITQQATLSSAHSPAEAAYQTSTTPQPTHGPEVSCSRGPINSQAADSWWNAMSINRSVIWASGVESRQQRNMSRPFFPNSTAVVSSTPTAERVPSAHLGQISSVSNGNPPESSPLVPSPSEKQQTNSTLFTGGGRRQLTTTAVSGAAVLLSFIWFLWQ